jgi:hypothetical protein
MLIFLTTAEFYENCLPMPGVIGSLALEVMLAAVLFGNISGREMKKCSFSQKLVHHNFPALSMSLVAACCLNLHKRPRFDG